MIINKIYGRNNVFLYIEGKRLNFICFNALYRLINMLLELNIVRCENLFVKILLHRHIIGRRRTFISCIQQTIFVVYTLPITEL